MSVLVDIISNAAGMMILVACIALISKVKPSDSLRPQTKPIDYPLSYLPVTKSAVSLVLKNNRLYILPADELLEAVIRENKKGLPIQELEVDSNGVNSKIQFTQTGLGFRFIYKMKELGGILVKRPSRLKKALDDILKKYPHDNYFVSIYCWPEDYETLRDVREYLNARGMVVGWQPRYRHPQDTRGQFPDVVMAYGEYSDGFSSLKAQ